MTALIAPALALALHLAAPTQAAEAWTWTLYPGNDGPLVLANEIPDTPRLRATLECAPGSSIVRLTLYGAAPAEGFAVVTAGSARADAQVQTRRDRLQTSLRTDQPVFVAFMAGGVLSVAAGEQSTTVEIDRPNLPKLRRFAEQCTG